MQAIKQWLPDIDINYWLQRAVAEIANRQRQRYENIGYVLFTLPANMPALPEQRSWVRRKVQGDPPLSLAELAQAFKMIAEDDRAQGAVLHMRGTQMPQADLQTLRNTITWLREKGKRVICYAQSYDTNGYYVASAADTILLQPGGDLMTTGMRINAVFLKDSLEALGVEIEAVAISPYKSAMDQFTQSDITPESKDQFDWLLDSFYERIVQSIADGRAISTEDARWLIDKAPHTDQEALAAGYVDALVNEEGLAAYLEIKPDQLVTWDTGEKRLYLPVRDPSEKHVALLQITGMIVPGESQNPPGDLPVPLFGDGRSGDLTVVQQVRQLMEQDDIGAVILFIDSPGGSATASEAMASALDELAKKLPVVAFMNNVAASGGYYVATPAQWIVAQPGTITGSIGVINGKPTTQGMFEKLRANRVELMRGANASYGSDVQPLTPEQEDQMRKSILSIYDLFTRRVAESRNMTQEQVDAIGGGRVWTGEQALENGLVDQLGDLRAALEKARELASLPDQAPLLIMHGGNKDALAPRVAESVDPAASLRYVYENMQLVFNGRAQVLMPFTIE